MATYYHVTTEDYQDSDPLVCRDRLEEMGIETAWKWGEDAPEGYDGDVVCLFTTLAEAEDFQHEFGGRILRVEIPDGALNEPVDCGWAGWVTPRLVRVDEGYPAVRGAIPAAWIVG